MRLAIRRTLPIAASILLLFVPAAIADSPDSALSQAQKSETATSTSAAPSANKAPRPLFSQRIVNGDTLWSLPSVVSILVLGGSGNLVTNCSGTLIGCDTVLSAAHCFFGATNPASYLVFGQNTGISNVSSISIHPLPAWLEIQLRELPWRPSWMCSRRCLGLLA